MDLHFALVSELRDRASASGQMYLSEPRSRSALTPSSPLPIFAAKGGELSPIRPGSDSGETGSQTNIRNSFHSVEGSQSFLELLTEFVDAFNRISEWEVVKLPDFFGAEFRCATDGGALRARRKWSLGRVFTVLQNEREAAEICQLAPGVYHVRSAAGLLARVAFVARAQKDSCVRLAEVDCYNPSRRLRARRKTQSSAKDFALVEDDCNVFSLRKTAAKRYRLQCAQMSPLLAFCLAVSSLVQSNH